MTTVARGIDLAFGLLVVLVITTLIALRLVPAMTGLQPLTILTGSMNPTLPPGSLIWVNREAMPQIDEMATYLTSTTPVTHRVVGIHPDITGWKTEYIFRGDANQTDDPKAIPAEAILGTVAASVPALGLPAYVLSQPIGIALTLSLGLLLLAVRSLIPTSKETLVIEDRPTTKTQPFTSLMPLINNWKTAQAVADEAARLVETEAERRDHDLAYSLGLEKTIADFESVENLVQTWEDEHAHMIVKAVSPLRDDDKDDDKVSAENIAEAKVRTPDKAVTSQAPKTFSDPDSAAALS